jgi:uncharacterized protein involved in outer membrane biogenesis
MSLFRRRPVRVLAVIVGVLALAVLAVTIFLPADKIRDMALDQARARLGREVTVGDIGVSFSGGLGVRLDDFVIHNPDGFGGEPFLTTRGLDLKLEIGPLLKKEVRVHRLVVDGPQLHLVKRADGTDNFTFELAEDAPPVPAAPGGEGGAAPPPAVSISSLTLKDGGLVFIDERAPEGGMSEFRLESLNSGLSLVNPAPGQFHATGRVTADRIVVVGPPDVPELDTAVDFDVTWDQNLSKLAIAKADAEVLDLPLNATGDITVGDAGPTGNVRVAVPEQPVVGFKAFLPPELAPKLTGDDKSGTVAGTFDVGLTGDAANAWVTRGQLNANNVDLALAQPFMPPEQPGKLAGRGDLAVTIVASAADLEASEQAADWRGTATLRDVSFTESGYVDELQDLDGTLSFNPEVFTVEQCRATFASATVDLTGSLSDPFPYFLPPEMQEGQEMKTPHLEFELSSSKLDVDRLIPAASPTGPEAAPGKPGMTKREPVPADVEFPAITGEGTFRADTLLYMQVPVTDVTGKVTLADRKLKVSEVEGHAYQGTLGGQLDIDLNDLNDPVYAGEFAARDIEVDNFATRFAGMAGVVFGGANLSGAFNARGLDPDVIRNSLTLDADALLAEGRVVTSGQTYEALNSLAARAGGSFDQEQVLRDLATHIKVENGRVGLNDLTTRLGRVADVTVGGWYSFTGNLEYHGSLLLTEAQTNEIFARGAMLELANLLGSQRPARLELPMSVGGTRSDPKVKIDIGAVLGDLQEAALKEQGNKLEEEAKSKLGDLLKGWK